MRDPYQLSSIVYGGERFPRALSVVYGGERFTRAPNEQLHHTDVNGKYTNVIRMYPEIAQYTDVHDCHELFVT